MASHAMLPALPRETSHATCEADSDRVDAAPLLLLLPQCRRGLGPLPRISTADRARTWVNKLAGQIGRHCQCLLMRQQQLGKPCFSLGCLNQKPYMGNGLKLCERLQKGQDSRSDWRQRSATMAEPTSAQVTSSGLLVCYTAATSCGQRCRCTGPVPVYRTICGKCLCQHIQMATCTWSGLQHTSSPCRCGLRYRQLSHVQQLWNL